MAKKKMPLGRLRIVCGSPCVRRDDQGYEKGTLMESTAVGGLLQGLFLCVPWLVGQ